MIDSESILETYLDSFSRLHRSSVPRDSSSLPRMKDIRKLLSMQARELLRHVRFLAAGDILTGFELQILVFY